MRILYVATKYDYGDPARGFSFEHETFLPSLLRMGNDILYFDFVTLLSKLGRPAMNRRLWEVVRAERPDLLFCVLFEEQLDRETVSRISTETDTLTMNWFCDDHWRFDDFSCHWAPCFNWVITTAQSALPKYAAAGYKNVIKSQWACNHHSYRRLDLPLCHDVTFVGQPHGDRRAVIDALQKAGIEVKVWGYGWNSGRLSQEEMIRVFNQSRINLNLSNASCPRSTHAPTPRAATRRWVSSTLDTLPLGGAIKTLGKRILGPHRAVSVTPIDRPRRPGQATEYAEQIKARNFEVPGCGGFMLTGAAEDLGSYYTIGSEIESFDDLDSLVEKARWYLDHEDERATVAKAGYERTLREHTYAHRFAEIFQCVGLPAPALEAIIAGTVCPGQSEEVH